MSLIQIKNLSFTYEGQYTPVFENMNLQLDTDWKLGLSGRNGRGKTTFLNILGGKLTGYTGQVNASVQFTYFPFPVKNRKNTTLEVLREVIAPFAQWEKEMEELLGKGDDISLARYAEVLEKYIAAEGYTIEELITKEVSKLGVEADTLKRPFATLSGGEQTKTLLACLFLKKNHFLLIDEPTNHLDLEGRQLMSDYLKSKKGYILVSHDRTFLDNCIDHILSINRSTITVIKGDFSSWFSQKQRTEQFELQQNEKLKKDIKRLQEAALKTADWSDKVEATKKGGTRIAGLRPDRGFLGAKAAKMMKRSKVTQNRVEKAIEEKQELFKDQELLGDISVTTLKHHQKVLVRCENLSLSYEHKIVANHIDFVLKQGQRFCVSGKNGSGKSTLLKLITGQDIAHTGTLQKVSGLEISYVNQQTEHIKGSLQECAGQAGADYTKLLTLLRKLGFPRESFEKQVEHYSMGQKKKVLLALSLCKEAHLYVWDEPLNYIDLDSRLQIENLILNSDMTLLFVEHDKVFQEKIATDFLQL